MMCAEGHASCKLQLKSHVCQQAAFTTTSYLIAGLGLPAAKFFTALGKVSLQKFPLSGSEFMFLTSVHSAL